LPSFFKIIIAHIPVKAPAIVPEMTRIGKYVITDTVYIIIIAAII